MWPETVSRETQDKLDHYLALLHKWQKKINLVSNATLQDAMMRHFQDSAQLLDYMPENTKTMMDWGSGAGFPGLVLAILRPDINVHLVESDQRKCAFLKTVSRETELQNTTIHNLRIENLDGSIVPDLITARALSSLKKLLDYALVYQDAQPTLLFLKGEAIMQEMEEARKVYQFDDKLYPSVTSPEAQIIEISSFRALAS